MKCRTCQYDLWRLKPPGPCPECGTPFDPTTYTFRPNAARFLCPSCSVAYAGNGRDGLPRPRSFQCVKCGSPVVASAMAVEPAPGVDPERIIVREFPWPHEPGRSRIGAFMRTLGWSLTSPGRLGANMPQEGGSVPAMRFAFWVWLLTVIFSFTAVGIVMFAFAFVGRGGGTGSMAAGAAGAALALICFLLATVLIACPAWGGLAHLVLLGGSPQGGIGRSLRCTWYATGPFIVCAVPCLGYYLSPVALIWSTVSMANMLCRAHRVHALRATIAAMLLPILLLGVLVVTMVLPFMGLFGAGLAGAGWSSTVQIPSDLSAAVRASSRNGLAQNHIFDAPPPYPFNTWDVIQGGGTTFVLPDGSTLSDFDLLTAEQRAAIVATAGDGPLYLLADTIFCHRGMKLTGANPGLWLAFTDPRADSSGLLIVHLANGQQDYVATPWKELVRDQNKLRAAAGLEPIPENQDELPARPPAAP